MQNTRKSVQHPPKAGSTLWDVSTSLLTVDSAVSTIGPAPHLGRPVDLDVLYHQGVCIEHLDLRVALCVLEHAQQHLCTLLGPPALGPWGIVILGLQSRTLQVEACSRGHVHSAYLRFSPDAAVVPPEGHDLLLGYDVIEVAHGLPEVHVLDSVGRLAGVLEVDAQVKAPRLACYERGNTDSWLSTYCRRQEDGLHLAAFSGSVE